MSIRNRKLNRLCNYDYSKEGFYYATICTKDRKNWFGQIQNGEMILNEYGVIVNQTWWWLFHRYEYILMDKFVIMPDHFHAIICINHGRGGSRTAPTKSLGRLIGAFKTVSTKKINQIRNTPKMQLWQRSFYDRVIRDDQELCMIRKYISENPLRHMEENGQ